MLDILVLAGLLVALVRGYRRGMLGAAAGLVVLVAAILVGYRAGPAGQGVVESWTGSSPMSARLIASLAAFVLVLVVGRLLVSRIVQMLGPLRVFDQIGGAVLSMAAFALVAGLLILAVNSAPYLPSTVDSVLAQSRIVSLVRAEGPRFTPVISRFLGDRLLESYVNLRKLSDEGLAAPDGDVPAPPSSAGEAVEDGARIVRELLDRFVIIEGDDRVDIPPVAEPLEARSDVAMELLDRLNLLRVEQGEEPLAWSAALAEIAAGHGAEMYAEGYFSHVSPSTGSVGDRLASQGIPFLVAGENLALNPTVDGVHEGLASSPGHRAAMLESRFTRVGISAHDGPLGLMVVQVFTG